MDVNSVCTHAQLDNYLGGQLTSQTSLIPAFFSGDSSDVRTWALDQVLKALGNRIPPIYEGDLADPADLRTAVQYGAAMRLYDLAITSGGDAELWGFKMKNEERRFLAELATMKPKSGGGVILPPGSIAISRR